MCMYVMHFFGLGQQKVADVNYHHQSPSLPPASPFPDCASPLGALALPPPLVAHALPPPLVTPDLPAPLLAPVLPPPLGAPPLPPPF
ncbi:leucine-rich repeat extensin-like protein 3 [Rhododendron vialii]|uniref:leucine-rich repeat extensin-like protein 3 n=1 Tax=Rhododendron vialii TaxID=182163 RepID=UPI0026602390|nr:leucine-rich repeat extensin-like protein 3 [Rhododendron vialii]